MARTNGISPSVSFTEQDFTVIQRNFGITTLGLVGETQKGRAFTPTFIQDYDTFKTCFGGLNPCKFKDSQQLKYESSYIAKEYLKESDRLYVVRTLGLSGYDAGDAWALNFGASLDIESVEETDGGTFSLTMQFVDGEINVLTFSDDKLQKFYDEGLIPASALPSSNSVTGDTFELEQTFFGDCNTFTGLTYDLTALTKDEPYLCVSGETETTSVSIVTGNTQSCAVEYSGGSITYNSLFAIDVIDPIVFINTDTNALHVISNGQVAIQGGTITHDLDDSITFEDSTIIFPNGDSFLNSNFKVCDLKGNDAIYDCETVSGDNITIVTGTTVTSVPTIVTGSTVVVTEFPTGIVEFVLSGSYVQYIGLPLAEIDNTVFLMLRSNATYDGDEALNFKVVEESITIESLDGKIIKPYDDFKLLGTLADGNTFEYIVSMDSTKKNYLKRVFGSFILCCESKIPIYIEEIYDVMFDNLVADGKIHCIKPTVCTVTNLNNYKTKYRGASTPFVVSELRGNTVERLFKFYTIGDGAAANKDFKISIKNIRPDKRTFDIDIRAFGDTDKNPVVLESFPRVSMSKSNNNYIGRKIGTVDGEYSATSKYVLVDVVTDCLEDAFPAGFEGYPIRDYSCGQAPDIQYKTEYTAFERKRNVYLGLSDIVGFDQDMFDFKGLNPDTELIDWTGTTKGFHLDKDATTAIVNSNLTLEFETGADNFQNEADLEGTTYDKIYSRKFTLVPYGGFDGWDIFREQRTNEDTYQAAGNKGLLGLAVENFDAYANTDGDTVITSDYYAYLEAIRTFANPEFVKISLLATPGINTFDHSNLIEETIEMLESERCDTFYVPTTPDLDLGFEPMTANGIVTTLDGLYDTSYAATYTYWGQYEDVENNVRVWLPPTAEVMRAFALTDKTKAPWWAAAGMSRGITSFIKSRVSPKIADRDTLYEGRVNPLTTFPEGVYIWGNRTLQEADTLLKQINIRRLLLHVQRLIGNVSINLLFEQADDVLKQQFDAAVRPILTSIVEERGITKFTIELDVNSNAAVTGELNGKICIQPTPALEQINIGFCLTNDGAAFDNI